MVVAVRLGTKGTPKCNCASLPFWGAGDKENMQKAWMENVRHMIRGHVADISGHVFLSSFRFAVSGRCKHCRTMLDTFGAVWGTSIFYAEWGGESEACVYRRKEQDMLAFFHHTVTAQ